VCADAIALAEACERAFCFDDEILVERFVPGQEVSVAIVGERALGAIEIVPRADFYDFTSKYAPGQCDYFVPPRLSPERYRGCLSQALRAHQALGCSGATRVDMIVNETGNEYVLEVNTLPGLTPTSLLPKIAAANGLAIGDLVEAILGGARLATVGRGNGDRRAAPRPFAGPDRRADRLPEHH
jgi:D-alanine-D-alanine ligase